VAVKLSDVARMAGVSTATVSRIINKLPGYSEETREKVLRVIEESGFQPNALAQGLVNRKSNTIGVLLPSLSTHFSSLLIRGIERAAYSQSTGVFICNTDNDGERTMEYLSMLTQKRVDGIIFASEWLTDDYANFLKKAKVPAALVATASEDNHFPYVKVDDYSASRDAVKYLIQRGHRKIGFITGRADDPIAGRPRIEGYRAALRESGLDPRDADIAFGNFHFESGVDAMAELYGRGLGHTAVFASSDEMALGAMSWLHAKGISIPEEMSVMGYDDTIDARISYPTLTTLRQPIEAMGEKAFELLMDGPNARSVIMGHSITSRDSVRDLI